LNGFQVAGSVLALKYLCSSTLNTSDFYITESSQSSHQGENALKENPKQDASKNQVIAQCNFRCFAL
jgi:hypothetical protein